MHRATLSMSLAVAFVLAACGGAAAPSSPPSAGPSAGPSAAPSPAPSAPPSEDPSPAPSPGIGKPARFWIDPASLPLNPTAKTIKGYINELSCASGQPPEGRVLEPVVAYESDTITITVSVTPREGDQDCQGNPDFPVEITLTEPIGDRTVLDGSADPPRDATTRPS